MLLGRFEFITGLQYKVKHLQYEVDAFKTGEKYVKMNSNFQAMLTEQPLGTCPIGANCRYHAR